MEIDIESLPITSYLGYVINKELKTLDIDKMYLTLEGTDKDTGHCRKVNIERNVH